VRVVRLAYSSTLKIDAVRSSETSVDFYQTIRHHILEDSSLHSYRNENLKANGFVFVLAPYENNWLYHCDVSLVRIDSYVSWNEVYEQL
jgi:hypothetical protein